MSVQDELHTDRREIGHALSHKLVIIPKGITKSTNQIINMRFPSVVLGLVCTASLYVIPVLCHLDHHNNHQDVQDENNHTQQRHNNKSHHGLKGIFKDDRIRAGGRNWATFKDWARSDEFVTTNSICTTTNPPAKNIGKVNKMVKSGSTIKRRSLPEGQ